MRHASTDGICRLIRFMKIPTSPNWEIPAEIYENANKSGSPLNPMRNLSISKTIEANTFWANTKQGGPIPNWPPQQMDFFSWLSLDHTLFCICIYIYIHICFGYIFPYIFVFVSIFIHIFVFVFSGCPWVGQYCHLRSSFEVAMIIHFMHNTNTHSV